MVDRDSPSSPPNKQVPSAAALDYARAARAARKKIAPVERRGDGNTSKSRKSQHAEDCPMTTMEINPMATNHGG